MNPLPCLVIWLWSHKFDEKGYDCNTCSVPQPRDVPMTLEHGGNNEADGMVLFVVWVLQFGSQVE